MADFAPNFTARYRLHYTALGKQHSMLWRIARGAGTPGLPFMIAKVTEFLDALAPVRFTDWQTVSAEFALEDVDIFAPAGLPSPIAGAVAIPADFLSQSTLTTGFVGRSSAGQKARMFVYGCASSPELGTTTPADNFRITASESAVVAAAIAELNAGSPTIVGSDNMPVSWYSYVNVKYNDHWVAVVRA